MMPSVPFRMKVKSMNVFMGFNCLYNYIKVIRKVRYSRVAFQKEEKPKKLKYVIKTV